MTTLTNQSKNTATLTNWAKNLVNQFLLLENSGYILLETGFKIILDQSIAPTVLTNEIKN